jgi:hypothetical protein
MEMMLSLVAIANIGVILGVILEEKELLRKIDEFRRQRGLLGLFAYARQKGLRKSLSVAGVGFVILTVSLSLELLFQVSAEIESNNELGDLQGRNIELEKEVSPRTLTERQRVEIASHIKPFSDVPVSLIVYPTDAEGRRLAAQLGDTLHNAGIHTPYDVHSCGLSGVSEPFGQLITGVYVTSGDKPMGASLLGPKLIALLNASGIATQGGRMVHCAMPFGQVEVFVGVKPIEGLPPYDDTKQ